MQEFIELSVSDFASGCTQWLRSGGRFCIIQIGENYKDEWIYWNIYNFIGQYVVNLLIFVIFTNLYNTESIPSKESSLVSALRSLDLIFKSRKIVLS